MATDIEKIELWKSWLQVLDREVFGLAHNRDLFQQMMALIRSNPKLPPASVVYDWLAHNYAASAAMGVRRALDPDKKVISFVRLLEAISAAPQAITREWFIEQYDGLPWAAADFDKFAPKGGPHVDTEVVRRDLEELGAANKRFRNWIDNLIAHRNEKVALKKSGNPPVLTWPELNEVIDLLGRMLEKYELLLNQKGLASYAPVIQEPLEWVFGVPWMTLDKEPEGSKKGSVD